MYEDTLRKHLNEVIDNLGIEDDKLLKRYKNYKLEISDKNLRSRNGMYTTETMKIQITRHSHAKNANNVKTALHELAHHLDYCKNGTTGHKKEFYEQYRALLYSALDLDKITLDEMMQMTYTSQDHNKVMKMLKEYVRKNPVIDVSEKKKMYEINVSGLSPFDKRLIPSGYKYNQRRKTWYRNIYPETVDFEKQMLEGLGISDIKLKDANMIQLLDDEAEYLNNLKELSKRKETILVKSKKEYKQLQAYIKKLVYDGFEFDDLFIQLDGYQKEQVDGHERFGFRYVTLAGSLELKAGRIKLSEVFDIYEYQDKESRLVLKDINIRQIKEAVETIR